MPDPSFTAPAAAWSVPSLLVGQVEHGRDVVNHEDVFGMLGQLQRWIRDLLMAETHIQQAALAVVIEDEGNFEKALEKMLADTGLAITVATPAWNRVTIDEVRCSVEIKVAEVVILNRNRPGFWVTALGAAELCMGAIEGQRGSENGWTDVTCRTLVLESQTPWLIYKLTATTSANLATKGVRT